jgi:hypothetical protein
MAEPNKCSECLEYYAIPEKDNMCNVCYLRSTNMLLSPEELFNEWCAEFTILTKHPKLMTSHDERIFLDWLCETPRTSGEIFHFLLIENHTDYCLFFRSEFGNQIIKGLRDYVSGNEIPEYRDNVLYGTIPSLINEKYIIAHLIYGNTYDLWNTTEDVKGAVGHCYYKQQCTSAIFTNNTLMKKLWNMCCHHPRLQTESHIIVGECKICYKDFHMAGDLIYSCSQCNFMLCDDCIGMININASKCPQCNLQWDDDIHTMLLGNSIAITRYRDLCRI